MPSKKEKLLKKTGKPDGKCEIPQKMKHSISQDNTKLTLTLHPGEAEEWRETREESSDRAGSDMEMINFLEPLTCNSDLDWIPDGTTGDLTSAPMLGITGPEEKGEATPKHGYIPVGYAEGTSWRVPVLSRWIWANYETKSLIDELLEKGEAILQGGTLKETPK